jgi:hypothetical protein
LVLIGFEDISQFYLAERKGDDFLCLMDVNLGLKAGQLEINLILLGIVSGVYCEVYLLDLGLD